MSKHEERQPATGTAQAARPQSLDLLIPISFFASTQDTGKFGFHGNVNRRLTWGEVGFLLEDASRNRTFATKEEAPLFGNTVYAGTRARCNATECGMLVVDSDGGLPIREVVDLFQGDELEAILYTSARADPNGDRWRLLVPLRGIVEPAVANEAIHALKEYVSASLGKKVGDAHGEWDVDTSKLNCHSIFYVPAQYASASSNQFYHVSGAVLGAQDWLAAYPQPEPHVTSTPYRASYEDHDDLTLRKAKAALEVIPADIRHDRGWLSVGMILHDLFGGEGFGLWDSWSRGASNYDPKIMHTKWASFRSGGVNVGTLFMLADQNDPAWREQFRTHDVWDEKSSFEGVMGLDEMLRDWEGERSPEDLAAQAAMQSEAGDPPRGDDAGSTREHDAGYTGRASTGNRLTPIHSAADLPDRIPPRQWLLDVYWCLGFVSSTSSGGGSGKSSLMLARCIETVTGRQDITGEHVFRVMPVLYCCFEDDKNEIERRLQALCKRHNIQPSELRDFHYHIIRSGDVLAEYEEGKNGKMREGSLVERLRNTIIENRYGVVVLDPFVNTHNLPENDNTAMNYVKRVLVRLASELNIAVDIPHHTPKGPRTAGDADNWRGGSALKDGLRLCYTLTTMTEAEATHYGIDPAERYRYIHSDSAKVNIAPGGQTRWFQLESVNLDNGDELYPNGDNVQALAAWTPSLPPAAALADDLEAQREILRKIEEHDPPYAFNHKVGKKLTWVKHAFQDHFPGISMPQMEKILNGWVDRKLIEYTDLPSPNQSDRSGRTYLAVVRLPEQDMVDRMSA